MAKRSLVKRSLTTRLAAMFALVAVVAFTLIGAALYAVLHRELVRQQMDVLNTTSGEMMFSLTRMGTPERWARGMAKMDTLTPADGSLRFWVVSPDPHFSYGRNAAELARIAQLDEGYDEVVLPGRDRPMRTFTRTVDALEQRPQVKFVVGIATEPYLHTLHTFVIALAGLLLAAVLVIMLLCQWMASVGLRPLKRLSSEAQQISPAHPEQRLRAASLPVELDDLAHTFNGALDRLQSAYTQLEAFNADVAHELRTPLTNLIGQTQVALARPRSARELEETLQSNLEELDRLRAIVNDMLFLARADRGEAATGLVDTVVADEVGKTIEFFEFVLDDLGLTVAVEGDTDAVAPMDRALFRRAVTNLLQNAIQHTRGGTRIVVRLERQAGGVSVTVSNPGDPIDAAHLPRLFDRFYRVDAARNDHGAAHGHGLGLAIVKAVASMHGGRVFAFSAGGSTAIGFNLPQ
ncbi:heavy metal sensor histidine kinase [Achromobacter aloeverae]